MAEKKKIYRDEIEREVISLAPELDEMRRKITVMTYDEKVEALRKKSDESVTWINLLNCQTMLQHVNMLNLNMLGRNRFRFTDVYTIGCTPVVKNVHYVAGRLYELNKIMIANLGENT